MATSNISSQAQQSLDALLSKIGAKKLSDAQAASGPKTMLGQDDFLKLMTAQMSNQDPFQPQSNTEMIAQMAQRLGGDQSFQAIADALAKSVAQMTGKADEAEDAPEPRRGPGRPRKTEPPDE